MNDETAYLVMHWNYDQSAPVAVFLDEEKAEEYVRQLSKRTEDSGYAVEEMPLKTEVPSEYVRWMGYAFKYSPLADKLYTTSPTFYVRPVEWDDLSEPPRPLMVDRLDRHGEGKVTPFYVVHVEGTAEETVRERYVERVAEGEAWLAGLEKKE